MKRKITFSLVMIIFIAAVISGCRVNKPQITQSANKTNTLNTDNPTGSPDEQPTTEVIDPEMTDAPTPFNPNATTPVATKTVPVLTPVRTVTPKPIATVKPNYLEVGQIKPVKTPTPGYTHRFFLEVDITNQCVDVYEMFDEGVDELGNVVKSQYAEPKLVDRFICSSGLSGSDTPLGVFYLPKGPNKGYTTHRFSWAYFTKFEVWAKYATRIDGAILFHSIIYAKKDESTLKRTTYNNLGKRASHGCIRLLTHDAKWIYDNCPAGTMVNITTAKKSNSTLKKLLKENKPPFGKTPTPRPTVTGTDTYLPSASSTPAVTPSVTQTATPIPTPTVTPAQTPTEVPTQTPTDVPSQTPTEVPTETPGPTPTPSAVVF